jgi:transposase
MRKKGTRAEWDRVRAIAANMLDLGRAPAEIAAALGVDDQTVRRWRRAYAGGGRDALVSRKPPGRPARLGDAQREQLAALLERTPAGCGFDKYLWTTQLVADLIAREFGVTYHHDHVGVLLGAMGFTHQKPARRARETDPAAVEAWRRQTWPALLKKTPPPAA